MKKLMIAAAIVCAAAFTQASQIKWSLEGVTAKDTTTTEGYMAYFIIASDSSASTPTAKIMTLEVAMDYAAAGNYAVLEAAATMVGSVTAAGTLTTGNTAQNTSWIKNVAVESFAIIMNNADPSAATYYTIGLDTDENPAVLSLVKFSGGTNKSTAYVQQSGGWSAVSAVPEPTSGLLLLLGVAGLALRRRRA